MNREENKLFMKFKT